ncbi:hypothetical protein [Kangsaoukella pontilimi]|nr:hypothetical protein [Kangsaoukella pontilimi]
MRTIWQKLRALLIGRRLQDALDRNTEAAERLDCALQEALKR